MKELFTMLILSGTLAAGQAVGQEHKHEEHKEELPAQKGNDAAKAESKKCCEGMEKTGETKESTQTKAR